MYLTFEQFMEQIKDLYDNQNYIVKALTRLKPHENATIPKFRKLTDQCFQLKSNDECGSEPVKEELIRIQGKLEELAFRSKASHNVIIQWEEFEKQYIELRKKAITDVNLNINDVMKRLGFPDINFDVSAGISKDDMDKIKGGDYTALQSAALSNQETLNAVAKTDSSVIMANSDKKNPDNGPVIKGKSDKLVNDALSSDNPDAGKAAKKMDGAQDKADIPSQFRKK